MKLAFLLLTILFSSNVVFANEWNQLNADNPAINLYQQSITTPLPQLASYFELSNPNVISDLTTAAKNNHQYELKLPTSNGQELTYIVSYDPIYPAALAAKFPNMYTFKGYRKDNPKQTGRFDIGPNGFHASYQINQTRYYLDQHPDFDLFILYPYQTNNRALDTLIEVPASDSITLAAKGSLDTNNRQLTTYRLAVATTAEYSNYFINRNQQPLNAIVTTINRVNEIFQRDLAIRLELIADNDLIIYTNANTDPFLNNDNKADLDNVQKELNSVIGSDNYDIGHLFTTSGGGIAGVGVVCSQNFKAKGATGHPAPTGESFYVDFVAHEIGHQFDAEHSFNGTDSFCEDGRNNTTAYELGSGVTIMGYAGTCDNENVANSSIAVFHSKSIEQINTYINNGVGNTCGTTSPLNNEVPIVDAGQNYTIPALTPFVLTGTATDVENDNLTYSWEQYDLGSATSSRNDWQSATDGPLFRNWSPSEDNKRYFPRLDDLSNGRATPTEILPKNARTLTFKLLVKDQQGGIGTDTTILTVDDTIGPFTVLTPNDGQVYNGNEQITVTWQVNGTNALCSQIDILLSTNNGDSFIAEKVAEQIPNTGSTQIILPNLNTQLAKLMLKCSDNIFFNLSPGNFQIKQVVNKVQPRITAQDNLIINEDNPITLANHQLTIIDEDSSTFSLTIMAGNNYQVNEQTITPNADFNGQLIIPIQVNDGDFDSEIYNLLITVNPINDPPQALNDSYSYNNNTPTNLILDVLTNDSDIDSPNLSLIAINYQGMGSAIIEDNKIIYTPADNFNGQDNITYTISDGTITSQANASITVLQPNEETDFSVNVSKNGGSSGGLFSLLTILVLYLKIFRIQNKTNRLPYKKQS